jgi:hypothetical protein
MKKTFSAKVEMIMRYSFIGLTVMAIIYDLWHFDKENPQWDYLSLPFITLFLFILPTLFSRRTKIVIPPVLQVIILLFIFASMYLGEIHRFFDKYTWWDNFLHAFSATLLAYSGFLLIFALNNDKDIHLKLSPFFIALFTFCFASMIGVIWELFEFVIDEVLGQNMQKARGLCSEAICDSRFGVMDTMWDMVANTLGALFVSIIGYYYCRKKMYKDNTFWRLKDQFFEQNPDFFKNSPKKNLGKKKFGKK